MSSAPIAFWKEHQIKFVKPLKDQRIADLTTTQVDTILRPWLEKAYVFAEQNPGNVPFEKEIQCVKWAVISCDQGLELAQENGENGEQPRPQLSDELRFERVDEERLPEPPPTPLLTAHEQPEPSELSEHVNLEVLDPEQQEAALGFIGRWQEARENLGQTDDPGQAMRMATLAEILEALANAAGLGKEFEMLGKALRFESYRKASELYDPQPAGRRRNDGERQVQPFSKRDLNQMRLFGALRREDFDRILAQGLKNGALTEAMFRQPKKPKTPERQVSHPHESFVLALADMLGKEDVFGPQNAKLLVADDLIYNKLKLMLRRYWDLQVELIKETRIRMSAEGLEIPT